MRNDFSSEVQTATAKLAPVGLLATSEVAGWGPAEWMYALTAAYVVLQAIYLLWKWRREWKAKHQ